MKHIHARATNLEQLYTNDAEHEVEQECDQHNVADRLDSDDHALHDVLHVNNLSIRMRSQPCLFV